ncbi:CFA77 protein, partial [Galbula dea]|nr:CFA77 protein [Galbula dea]
QAEVGKPQRNCYTLPGFDFSYGLYSHRTDGGVPEAIGHWDTIKPRTATTVTPRDFVTMNRGAVRAGCTTAPEFRLYCRAKDIRLQAGYCHLSRSPPKVPADMTHGITARPSTPFFDLLQHKYKELWMEQQRALTVVQKTGKKKLDKARETRTTLLRKQPVPAKQESFWHLPSLEKVEPHLSTFPDPDARKKTFSA